MFNRRESKINHFADISQDKIAYLAGLIDGEGYVETRYELDRRRKNNYMRVRITVFNTFYPMIEWIQNNFGGSIGKISPKSPKHKTLFKWSISNKNKIRYLLPLLLPYLTVKEKKAEEILHNWL